MILVLHAIFISDNNTSCLPAKPPQHRIVLNGLWRAFDVVNHIVHSIINIGIYYLLIHFINPKNTKLMVLEQEYCCDTGEFVMSHIMNHV